MAAEDRTAAHTEFEVKRWSSVEYGTERPCEIARLSYKLGAHRYVALAFHYTDDDDAWRLTWLGTEGGDTARIPEGVYPSAAMLAALAVAPKDDADEIAALLNAKYGADDAA